MNYLHGLIALGAIISYLLLTIITTILFSKLDEEFRANAVFVIVVIFLSMVTFFVGASI